MSKKRDHARVPVVHEDEVTRPDVQMPPVVDVNATAKALGASHVEPAVDAFPIGQVRLSKAPPLDLAAVESECGWWEAIVNADVRLLEAWLAHHGAVVVSARTVERHDAFFRAVASRQSIEMTDHEVGFVLRRRA